MFFTDHREKARYNISKLDWETFRSQLMHDIDEDTHLACPSEADGILSGWVPAWKTLREFEKGLLPEEAKAGPTTHITAPEGVVFDAAGGVRVVIGGTVKNLRALLTVPRKCRDGETRSIVEQAKLLCDGRRLIVGVHADGTGNPWALFKISLHFEDDTALIVVLLNRYGASTTHHS